MTHLLTILSQDNKAIMICRSSSLNGPNFEQVSLHAGRGFWYFSVDNGKNWKISHIPSKTQLELKIKKMTLDELSSINQL